MQIENNESIIKFQNKGGEISSWIDKATNIEYMWQPDTQYWSGQNPTLFPLIGNTYTNEYKINNKTYMMKNHGLIRYATLEMINKNSNSIAFELNSNEETLRQYPFEFTYHITYTLTDKTLLVSYNIKNNSSIEMPFQFGLHPAFRCPLVNGEKFEDYKLIFDQVENLQQWHVDNDKLKPVYKNPISLQEIPCSYELFEKDPTLLFEGMKSQNITLRGKEHGVKVSLNNYPILALWTPKKSAPFLCIEPWIGHADFSPNNFAFEKRPYTMSLKAHEHFETAYTITIF